MSFFASPLSQHLLISPAITLHGDFGCNRRRLTGRHVICPCPRMSLNNNNKTLPNPNSSLLSAVTNLLWGRSLPPGLLVATVRTAWNSTWRLMMSQLAPSDQSGGYSRPASKFRASKFSGPTNNLHLYVGLPCPWAHRTLIVRALKGLEEAVPVSVASPGQDGSWEFKRVGDAGTVSPSLDKANGCKTLKEVYGLRKGGYDGRSTVPMLWDKDSKDVICNESYDIIELFNSGLNGLARNPGLDLSPPELKEKIQQWYRVIYPNVNNGVYRCGFAQRQEAYDGAVSELFSTLDKLEDHLASSRYLCGDTLTLVDVCLFTTLIRFDIVYNVLFKCTKKKLYEYPNLHAYMRDIYQDRFPRWQLLAILQKLWMVTTESFFLSIRGALDLSFLQLRSMKSFAGLMAGNPYHQLHYLSNSEPAPNTIDTSTNYDQSSLVLIVIS